LSSAGQDHRRRTAYSDFWYGPGRERIQQEAKKSASVTETTIYVGNYERVTRGATVEHVHYLRGGGDVVAIRKQIVGGSTATRAAVPVSPVSRRRRIGVHSQPLFRAENS